MRARPRTALALAAALAAPLALAALALAPAPRAAGRDDDAERAKAPPRTRVRIEVVRVAGGPAGFAPLTAEEIGAAPGDVVAPRAESLRATGELFAVRYPHAGLGAALAKRGEVTNLHGGDVELEPSRNAELEQIVDYPIIVENRNGEAKILTTQFKSIGLKAVIAWNAGDHFDGSLDLTTVERVDRASLPLIARLGARGSFALRDGYTTVIARYLAVRPDVLPAPLDEREGGALLDPGEGAERSLAFFFLLTRMDLAAGGR